MYRANGENRVEGKKQHKYMSGLFEILSNKEWAITPRYLNGAVELIRGNLRNHTSLGTFEKKQPYAVTFNAEDEKYQVYQRTADGEEYGNWYAENMQQPFVDILTVEGPITRNGGACSYGSKELRDMLMRCADNPYCCGHLFYIDTPGGSVWSKNDFRQAIDYAHERGQRVFAFVDGECCSMGMWLASMCDEVYVMNEEDDLGCIGVLASFFTLKNGAHNEFDAEDYHEIYDPESYDKNREIRDIAEDDNDKLLVEGLARYGVEFRRDIMAAFPDATDDMIHGKIFPAREVMGVFCDGVSTMDDCIRRLFDLSNGAAEPLTRTNNINPFNTTMGLFDRAKKAMNEAFENAEKQVQGTASAEEIANLNTRITEIQGERDNALAQVDTLTAERDNAAAERDAQIEQVNNLTAERDNLQTQLTEAQNTIAARDEEIKNLKSQLGSHYQPGSRMNGKSAGEGKENAEKTSEERKAECREKLGWTEKK